MKQALIVVLLFLVVVATGCSTSKPKPSAPPGYELDTTPETDGEGWL